jgi:hypothetical protein
MSVMASVTDDDLDQKRQTVEKLREQIAAEDSKKAERTAEQQREIEGAQLDAEVARLQARLNVAQAGSKAAAVKEGASGPIVQAQEQLKVAQAQADQANGPVDTNAGDSGEENKG